MIKKKRHRLDLTAFTRPAECIASLKFDLDSDSSSIHALRVTVGRWLHSTFDVLAIQCTPAAT